MSAGQRSLFGGREVAVDGAFGTLRRRELDGGAWVDYAPGWLAGHDALLDHLVRTTTWQQPQREMYDRTVDVPRLCASLPDDGPGHPAVETMRRALSARYAVDLPHVSLGYYRDGRDSVAWHGDYVAREMDEALVATVSLGERRRLRGVLSRLGRPVRHGRLGAAHVAARRPQGRPRRPAPGGDVPPDLVSEGEVTPHSTGAGSAGYRGNGLRPRMTIPSRSQTTRRPPSMS